jgi:phosphomannomutase
VKCYLEVVVPVEPASDFGGGAGVDAARISAVGRLDAIRADVQKAAGL